jgi:hypothetical protein
MLCILKLVNLFWSLSYCLSCLRLRLCDSTLFPRCCVFLMCISVDYYSWLVLLCCILLIVLHLTSRSSLLCFINVFFFNYTFISLFRYAVFVDLPLYVCEQVLVYDCYHGAPLEDGIAGLKHVGV